MMSFDRSAAMAATAVGLSLAGTFAIASMPLVSGLLAASLSFAGVTSVAFAAQSRRLRDESRLVYRPVYARRSNVRRPVRAFED